MTPDEHARAAWAETGPTLAALEELLRELLDPVVSKGLGISVRALRLARQRLRRQTEADHGR